MKKIKLVSMAPLHIFLLPLNAHGHMIPILDMAKLFFSHGVKTTIITTPSLAGQIQTVQKQGFEIGVEWIEFPAAELGLSEGIEGPDHITSSDDILDAHVKSIYMFQKPVEKLLEKYRPDCLVADMLYPWASDAAAKLGIPRLAFNGTSCFTACASENMRRYKPFQNVSFDSSESFTVPHLPHPITFPRVQLSENDRGEITNSFDKLLEQGIEALNTSYGLIFNSFYELEPEYADHHKRVLGKSWHIGPLFLCDLNNARDRGKKAAIDEHECLKWLDSKNPNSVIYISFGSVPKLNESQLHEIALGLEESGQDFIWVVNEKYSNSDKIWLPKTYEQRIKGKGMIIRGWAPQVTILNHPSIGAFVTHCGWNSILEGLCAGLPLVTWPIFAEQFYNEKLVTQVLNVGINVGNTKWDNEEGNNGVKKDEIVKALRDIMMNEKVRSRVNELKEKARKAVEPGGSAYCELSLLLEEIRGYRSYSSK